MRSNYWETRQRKLSRRRFVGGAAGASAGLAALAAVGCGDDDDDAVETPAATATSGASGSPTQAAGSPTAEPKPQGKKGGVTRGISSNATYDSFDASRSRFTPVATIIGRTMQRALFWDSFKDGTLGGGFAESWEQPDPQTVTLKLRKNNFFHNKAPVNGRRRRRGHQVHHRAEQAGKRWMAPKTRTSTEGRVPDRRVGDGRMRDGPIKLTEAVAVVPEPCWHSRSKARRPEAIEAYEKVRDTSTRDDHRDRPDGGGGFASEGRAKYQRFEIHGPPTWTGSRRCRCSRTAGRPAAYEQKQIDAVRAFERAGARRNAGPVQGEGR